MGVRFTLEDARRDILNYLNEQDDEYFEGFDRTREDVLEDDELIYELASEHYKCVTSFGNEREWSCKDACDSSPGLWALD